MTTLPTPFSSGGYLPKGRGSVSVSRSDDCPNGHPLYQIGGGRDEHVIPAAAMRDGSWRQIMECQRALDEAAGR